MEDQEALEPGGLVGHSPDLVQGNLDLLFADGVVTTGIVISGILFACDQLLWVKQLPVCSSSNLIHHSRLKINKHGTRYMLARSGFGEERVERVIGCLSLILLEMFQMLPKKDGLSF